VISTFQRDPGATRKLVETLRFGQVEVGRGSDGSAVIPMQQPYSGWAKALLERQNYPEDRLYPGGPPKRPYDVTAETLPLLMGVEVKAVKQAVPFSGDWQAPPPATGAVLAAADTDSWFAVNKAWAEGKPVWRDPAFGDFSLTQTSGWKPLPRPRIGLYRPWMGGAIDEGWTRWLLEHFGFAYTGLRNADIQAGGLRRKFDVLIFADQSAASIEDGNKEGTMPPEYVGGIGAKGAAALKEFANAGGTLIFLNDASEFAIARLGVAAKTVTAGLNPSEYYSPGSLLNVRVDLRSPLTYGLPSELAIWSEHSPAWETRLPVAARYLDSGVLASGWLVGEKSIAGQAALIDAPVGEGHVVLFGMRPQYRAQSYLTFKMFFNALVR
jgi:hypothetical protein